MPVRPAQRPQELRQKALQVRVLHVPVCLLLKKNRWCCSREHTNEMSGLKIEGNVQGGQRDVEAIGTPVEVVSQQPTLRTRCESPMLRGKTPRLLLVLVLSGITAGVMLSLGKFDSKDDGSVKNLPGGKVVVGGAGDSHPGSSDATTCRGNLDNLLTTDDWETLFPSRQNSACTAHTFSNGSSIPGGFYELQALKTAADKFPCFLDKADGLTVNKRELSAFLAQISHETSELFGHSPPSL